jgi:hypothetical protein
LTINTVSFSSQLSSFPDWPAGQPLRLVGVGLDHLSDGPRQRSLFERSAVDDPRIQDAVAKLKQRFGSDALRRGSDIESD